MTKILDIIGATLQKYGLFPAVAIIALVIGGYGCYQAKSNEQAIQQLAIETSQANQRLAIEQARTDSKLDATTKDLLENIRRMDNTLVELTTQIKLLVDGKLVISK